MSNSRTITAAATLAAGFGLASLLSAGTAQALPGVSYHDGNNEVGIGDHGTSTGANAYASPGNRALAISGFHPASATANTGSGNSATAVSIVRATRAEAGYNNLNQASNSSAFAVDGDATTWGGTNNKATAIGGRAFAGNGNNNNATAYLGEANAGYGNNNTATALNGKAAAGGNSGNQAFSNNNVLAVNSYINTNQASGQVVSAVCGQRLPGATDPSVTVQAYPGAISGISCLP